MKRIVIIFALLISAVSLTKAQGGRGGTPEERATASLGRLPAMLNLTTDQKIKITAIYVAQGKSQDDLRAAANGDIQSILPKMTAITADTDAKILALLTGNQKTTYQDYMKSRPAARGAGGGAGGGVPPAGEWDGGGVFPGGGSFTPRGQ